MSSCEESGFSILSSETALISVDFLLDWNSPDSASGLFVWDGLWTSEMNLLRKMNLKQF